MGSQEVFPSGLTFYGLTQEYKKYCHELMVNLTMNVDGFTYKDWYEMPINLRNYYTTVIADVNKQKEEYIEKINSSLPIMEHPQNVNSSSTRTTLLGSSKQML